MAFFTRRRTQKMIDELVPVIGFRAVNSLVKRLESTKEDTALPAEVELGFMWALSKIGPLENEPVWWGDRHPDVLTDRLVAGTEVALDIAGISNGDLGERQMARQTHQLVVAANGVTKRFGQRLFFTYLPDRGYRNGKYENRVLAGEDRPLSQSILNTLEEWIVSESWKGQKLLLQEENLSVQVEAYPGRRLSRNFRSSIVPGFTDVRRNPIYSALRDKRSQLKNEHFGGLRAVVIFDIGSDSISRRGLMRTWEPIFEYDKIIRQFFEDKADGLDFVLVISPEQPRSPSWLSATISADNLLWRVEPFARQGESYDLSGLANALKYLPRPRLLGYEARQLFRAGRLGIDGVGSYRNSVWTGGTNISTKLGFSSRAFADFLAGRISEKDFRDATGFHPADSSFSRQLTRGKAIKNISYVDGGIDADDDTIVLELDDDVSSAPFTLPRK